MSAIVSACSLLRILVIVSHNVSWLKVLAKASGVCEPRRWGGRGGGLTGLIFGLIYSMKTASAALQQLYAEPSYWFKT